MNHTHLKIEFSELIHNFRRILVGSEIAAIFLVSVVVSVVRFDLNVSQTLFDYPGQPKILIYPLIWYFFLHQTHAWDRSILYFSNDLYRRAISASIKSIIVFSAFAYLAKFPISRMWTLANVVGTLTTLLVIRLIVRTILSRRFSDASQLRYLYIGKDANKESFLREFSSLYGFTPSIIQFDPPRQESSELWLDRYVEKVNGEHISGAIIGYNEIKDAALIRQLADTSRAQVIDLVLISRIASLLNRFDLQEIPNVVRIQESHVIGSGAVIKRILDIIISIFALIILLPIFLLVAILIKLTSRGPILYIDKRVGMNGQLFAFPKFRSMYVGADRSRLDVLGRPDSDMASRYKSDPRITPLGRFLRRWSIDETPQFWSVLIGKMSIVGPRPILLEELPQVANQHLNRFMAKPGLTGLWQVTGRKEVAWEDRMLRDISYIDEWSFSKDCILILQTIRAIIRGEGAH